MLKISSVAVTVKSLEAPGLDGGIGTMGDKCPWDLHTVLELHHELPIPIYSVTKEFDIKGLNEFIQKYCNSILDDSISECRGCVSFL